MAPSCSCAAVDTLVDARVPTGGMPEGSDGVPAPPPNLSPKVIPVEEGLCGEDRASAIGEAAVKQEVLAAESSAREEAGGGEEVAIGLQGPAQVVEEASEGPTVASIQNHNYIMLESTCPTTVYCEKMRIPQGMLSV